ncbi:DUF3891 family protein [Paenibacillus spongiae]|uniref:DUF3891 family protein n=1 Tax=Paenibacillus spongiae TaxID=2909671 RepID=A0ABY5S6Y7_9BACL|nr:DUF3891 family protein [Paenibacillus spongiae]UVI29429.1 DUF3891 family protein [Paenibacillus spongiae]
MIIRETEHHFVMTAQDEHAHFSGLIANHFADHLFIDPSYRSDTILAIHEHDRSWIRLDETPIWNDRIAVPFSFSDYPLLPKLILYRYGLDETESMNEYAGLLCSLHFSSFQDIRQSTRSECVEFIRHEAARQQRIKDKWKPLDDSMVSKHLKLLQLCDGISLYVCLNEPGAAKENEHPWYREGFDMQIDDRKLTAQWMNEERIMIDPFPFKEAFKAAIRSKHVAKDSIKQNGIDAAYKNTPFTEQIITFVGQS